MEEPKMCTHNKNEYEMGEIYLFLFKYVHIIQHYYLRYTHDGIM